MGGKFYVIAVMITAMIAAITLITGCEETERPGEGISYSTRVTALEKAQKAMNRVKEKRISAQRAAEEKGDFTKIIQISDTIFEEELGFRKEFWTIIGDVYIENTPKTPEKLQKLQKLQKLLLEKIEQNMLGEFYMEYMGYFDPLVTEYLRLSFEFPEEGEEKLLIRFGESMKRGEIGFLFPF